LQPGLLLNQRLKSLRANSFQLIKFCYTGTDPFAETKSIGLQADAQLSWFLQRHLDYFIMTGQTLPIYWDQAVWTTLPGRENFRPSTGTLQKRMPTRTRTATQLNRRAVIFKP
jgi:hypothetical protein